MKTKLSKFRCSKCNMLVNSLHQSHGKDVPCVDLPADASPARPLGLRSAFPAGKTSVSYKQVFDRFFPKAKGELILPSTPDEFPV